MMKIWVMRHGEAGFNAQSDAQRTLTENGKKMANSQGIWLGNRLNGTQASLDKILCSPYQRTQQTSEHLLAGLLTAGYSKNTAHCVELWEGITPNGQVETVVDYLAFLRDEGAKNVLIISHLPLVFDLVQALTAHQATVHFYPAVLAEIDWTHTGGKLQLTHTPSSQTA